MGSICSSEQQLTSGAVQDSRGRDCEDAPDLIQSGQAGTNLKGQPAVRGRSIASNRIHKVIQIQF
jgi:hypothetical protein